MLPSRETVFTSRVRVSQCIRHTERREREKREERGEERGEEREKKMEAKNEKRKDGKYDEIREREINQKERRKKSL